MVLRGRRDTILPSDQSDRGTNVWQFPCYPCMYTHTGITPLLFVCPLHQQPVSAADICILEHSCDIVSILPVITNDLISVQALMLLTEKKSDITLYQCKYGKMKGVCYLFTRHLNHWK